MTPRNHEDADGAEHNKRQDNIANVAMERKLCNSQQARGEYCRQVQKESDLAGPMGEVVAFAGHGDTGLPAKVAVDIKVPDMS
ncbi:unnamed protein product [Clonostachys rosea]|uniref:Uncharacterized protein n=1 Tax=Bionectria ochroleuca TaxID=29856 RepID=A0ABY6U2S8_BIOOC|nr:unnamed protein product [Clonostachys rosea]